MSIFENANRNVEKHNYGMNSKFDRFGRRIIDLPEKQEPVTEDITVKIIQGPDTVKPELSPGEKSYRETKVQNAINYNTKSNIMKNMHSEILNGVLENVIESIYYDALYLDDDFKEYNSAAIRESVHDFLTERGGYKYIQEAYNRTKSPLLKSIMEICEETTREVSQRKIKECNDKANNKQSLDDIKLFDMTDAEQEKLNYEKETIGMEKISKVIKDKILNVVKEEKKREAEHVELIDEIENQLSEDENVNDEKAVAEALSSIFVQNSNLEEGTLFNSMLRKNYKNVIESGYDSLTLSKLDRQSELDELMNAVTLEDILIEDEIVDPKGQLITTEVKDVFNDFMDKLERQKDLGNTDADALLEAFACCENKFYEVANSNITKTKLKAIRRDFKILQETFNDFLPVEEGKITGAIAKGVDKVDSAMIGALYKGVVKLSKDPKVLRRQIERDKNIIRVCKAELKDREKLDDSKLQKIWKNFKGSLYYSVCSASVNERIQAGDRKGTKKLDENNMRQLIKYSEIFIKLAEKRIKELESGKKSVKESFDAEYDVWADNFDDDSIEIFDDFETVEEKNVITNNKFVDSVKDKFTPPGSKKKDKKEGTNCDNAGGCGTAKEGCGNTTKEGCGSGKCDTTKEGCGKSTKEACGNTTKEGCGKTTKEACSSATKEGCGSGKCDTTKEGCGKSTKEACGSTTKEGCGSTTKEGCGSGKCSTTKEGCGKSTKEACSSATKEGCGSGKCDTTKEGCGKSTKEGACGETSSKKIKKIDTAFDMDEKVKVKEHYYELFDIDDDFDLTEEEMSAAQTAKEATKNKAVKEACSDILDECMTIIDKKLDLHEASDLNMAREVCVRENSYNCPTIIPIMNKKDIQLEGLDLPYKMKHVLESLTNILTGLSNDDRTDIVAKALKTNKENVTAILESCKSIPSTPVYKINFFNTFNDLLDILTENVNDIAESNKLIDFREYDEGFLDMYEDDYTYKVITESFNDFSIEGGDEFIDMDFVLADTIAKYTLLETMYTLQLENPKYSDIKNITNKILNR